MHYMRRFIKLAYPELSFCGHQLSERKFFNRIETENIVIFDVWNVLVYIALESCHILDFFETLILFPNISKSKNFLSQLDEDQLQYYQKMCLDFCMDNVYMHTLWNYVKEKNKVIYIYNNAAFSDGFVNIVLKKFHYTGYLVADKMVKGVHITNDPKNRLDIRCKNINKLRELYSPYDYKNIITGFYNQIVNMEFYAGKKSFFYEYGFAYGGILAGGFSQYLNKLAKIEKIDKFLFVARDGYILKKVYDRYYKEYDTSYLLFSRMASYEIIFEDFPNEYIEKNIGLKIRDSKRDNSIKKILQECNLEFMEKYLAENHFYRNEQLNKKNYNRFKEFLISHKEILISHFQESTQAAKQYFLHETYGCNKVCIVDIGWRGTSAVYFKHLLENRYNWKGTVIGAMIGAASDDITQNHIRSGLLHTYAFDNNYYRRTGKKNGEYMSREETICVEALFSAESPSLTKYTLDQHGTVDFRYQDRNLNKEIIKEIHMGIMEFTKRFAPVIRKYSLEIMPRDAYTPLDYLMQNKRIRKMISNVYDEPR